MAIAQLTMTQSGALDPLARVPLAIRARVITPMVFCASLVPCASETRQADPICPILKPCPRAAWVSERVIRYSDQVPMAATRPAMTGESTAGMTTLDARPCQSTALPPAAAIVEPITPPMSAWEELDGIPNSQVIRFQMMPPASPAATTASVTSAVLTRPLADGSRHGQGQERADEVERTGNRHRGPRPQCPGGDRGRHRVARVVEAVREVESKCRQDHQHEHGVVSHNGDGKSRLVSSEESQIVQRANSWLTAGDGRFGRLEP